VSAAPFRLLGTDVLDFGVISWPYLGVRFGTFSVRHP
jgi:hypothetical protein